MTTATATQGHEPSPSPSRSAGDLAALRSALPCPWCETLHEGLDRCPACGRAQVVCSRYALTGVLGRGAGSVVYAALDTQSQPPQQVAVKSVDYRGEAGRKAVELLERGSAVRRSLDHPALPALYATELDPGGRVFVVSELLAGGSLEQRVVEQHRTLGTAEFLTLFRGLLEVLAYLHGRVPRVLHRDIKPSNILFRTQADWQPVVADLDTLALAGTGPASRTGMTIVVSPGYTAPEQLTGESTPASDLFSLGATLVFVATHTHPEDLPRREGRLDIADRLEPLGPGLADVLLRMSDLRRTERFQSVQEVLAALAELERPPERTILPVERETPEPAKPPRPVGTWTLDERGEEVPPPYPDVVSDEQAEAWLRSLDFYTPEDIARRQQLAVLDGLKVLAGATMVVLFILAKMCS